MPKYELMYLLGSQVADTDVPAITQRVQKHISDYGGSDIAETNLGKKKLAYPIKKTRNGTYIVVSFSMDTKKINEFDARLRTQEHDIIRYLIINLEEHLKRNAKDKIAQAKLSKRTVEKNAEVAEAMPIEKVKNKEKPAIKLEDIDDAALDKKIEEALTEDLTK